MAHDALLEIGVEEIPARFMLPALEQLGELLAQQLQERRLAYEDIRICGTPRRLAALISQVAEAQEDSQEEIKGPPAERAFDPDPAGGRGKPTQAALGFAKSRGIRPEDLVVRETDRGPYVFAVFAQKGRPAVEVLAEAFPQVISQLRFAKAMRWGYVSLRFARPIRWLVGLHGDQVVPFEVAGVKSGRSTRGHRFLAPPEIELTSPGDYLPSLREAYVIADHEERRQRVAQEAASAAQSAGGEACVDEELLNELTFLVEWPTGIAGSFDPEYLKLPEDVLITVLRKNQKYFPVVDGRGNLLPKFVTCHNGDPAASELIRQGHERVIRPRLADAQFYFEQDRQASLTDWQNELKRVVFMEGAGSMHRKCQRLQKLAAWLCKELRLPTTVAKAAKRAAKLCKADLVSKMVMEPDFSSLQGIMGGIYAELSGEPHDVALAIREHYLPTAAGGPLPQTPAGRVLSIADKMDTIACCFALGEVPTGTEDPHGLRRQAHGIVRMVLERGLPFSMGHAVARAVQAFGAIGYDDAQEDRVMQVALAEMWPLAGGEGFAGHQALCWRGVVGVLESQLARLVADGDVEYDVVRQVMSSPHDDFFEAWQRAQALATLRREEPELWGEAVIAANRVANILRPHGVRQTGSTPLPPPAPTGFEEEEERGLWAAFTQARDGVQRAAEEGDYKRALGLLAALKPSIDLFFDRVLVMTGDWRQQNRMQLLDQVDRSFLRLGDFQQIVQ